MIKYSVLYCIGIVLLLVSLYVFAWGGGDDVCFLRLYILFIYFLILFYLVTIIIGIKD